MSNYYMITDVEVLFPRLNRTYRFDKTENRSVPCGPFEEGARYEVSFKMDSKQAKAVMLDMAQAYTEKQNANDKWPEKFPMPFTKDDEGVYIGKTSLKGAYGTEATTPPRQFDSVNKELPDDFLLTTGTVANLAVELVPYMMQVGKSVDAGVSLRIRAVQVTKYVPLQVQSPFGAVEGFVQSEANISPFSDSKKVVEATEATKEEAPVTEPKKVVKLKASAPTAKADISAIVDSWDD